MKKIVLAILILALAEMAVGCFISPVNAQDYPLPPLNPDESWQPPYGVEGFMEPHVGVEMYSQSWPNLQIAPPSSVPPSTPSTIINASLVNNQGQILTNLYRNSTCYLLVSVNGPGYFYLWEYYPSGTTSWGHWLCYRWYCQHAGIWKIGPFSPESVDPAGEYTWKMWFLSGYTWSTRTMSFNYIRSYYPPDIPGLSFGQIISPVINSFTADKPSIEAGDSAVLTWTTGNTNNVTISPGIGTVASSGSTSVIPAATTTYTLVAKGKSGSSVSSTITITVNPRILPTISLGQSTIQKGQSTAISWNAPGAIQVSINNAGNVGIKGTMNVSPDKTTSYNLTATYADGTSQSASATVTVEQPPYLLWGLIVLLIIAAIVIAILLIRKATGDHRMQEPDAGTQMSNPPQSESTRITDTLPATTPLIEVIPAKFTLPDGHEIMLAGSARSFGRLEFKEFMPLENISYVSRQHIDISYENNHYYIEDRSSTNGTRINDKDIKGTGRHILTNGDVIELAQKLRITYKENI